ncbi:MAG: 4-hydroxybenzoate octaprenyltransferase [Oleispira antarctica]|uniref:4-hydroxybenzoate octaprenyltransferase n=1 Tax=Oleispira antarctica RB-8 TaxID=698738 RepID=R4YS67_OLEAN|nr:4-hydroxybenzoate octaprenyltransferase [Oleispira antarctica]MBQ0794168.1 4-hydroxybenzoate octaprenyltransferase [Oleispira antarctica]CCK78051.1 4-hydroxybenzoate octaprenyltransferase [Oleispira antarctica RB-8]
MTSIQSLRQHPILAKYWPKITPFIELMRLDKPVGIYLLLWPTLWALWIAAKGIPDISVLIIFTLGVFLMRSAGCVINDYADRKVDGHVTRTVNRPLITGAVTSKQALVLFFILLATSFVLVLFTNTLTIQLSFAGAALAAIYPYMKRHTHLPQVFLGAAFSWAIPMAFAAQADELPKYVWLIYMANLSWTVAYDTMYAMVDRDDDIKIGVKSTAILFADADKVMIAILQSVTIFCLFLLGSELSLNAFYYLGLLIAIGLMIYQQWLIRARDRSGCFAGFINSHWVGVAVLFGLILAYL